MRRLHAEAFASHDRVILTQRRGLGGGGPRIHLLTLRIRVAYQPARLRRRAEEPEGPRSSRVRKATESPDEYLQNWQSSVRMTAALGAPLEMVKLQHKQKM